MGSNPTPSANAPRSGASAEGVAFGHSPPVCSVRLGSESPSDPSRAEGIAARAASHEDVGELPPHGTRSAVSRSPAGSVPSYSRRLFESPTLRFGTFRAAPEDPDFAEAGQPTHHLIVFPRTSVWIEHEGRAGFVADPTRVTFYNRGDVYRRRALGGEGDRCDWFAVAPAVLVELVAAIDPAVVEHCERPFPFACGSSDAGSFALQRAVVRHVEEHERPDVLFVEETMLAVVSRLLRRNLDGARRPAAPSRLAVEVAARVAAFAGDRLDERLTLARLGAEVGCSPFQLCRLFKAATGGTVHGWLQQLRLRRALERVADPAADLTTVALDLGFCSHSHFGNAFRRAFGVAPSVFRAGASRRRVRDAVQGFASAGSRRSPRLGGVPPEEAPA